ncbi:sensor histidine kinase [Paenibacillus sp. YYML68]|uniref:cache domain-containing sensor histidine kinase n=1 Tax=Paenibacillus sp. YYML68 TaxID=2909250 RepID=UPI00249141BA|nr:sensor histidine kinase [Paenibacillus sp. YYML68]
MSLRHKIMIAVVLLVLVPVVLMGSITYRLFSNVIEKQTESFYATSLLETDRKIQYVLNELNGVSDISITQPLVQQVLKRSTGSEKQYPEGSIGRELEAELNKLILSHPKITSLSLYNQQGIVYSSGVSASMSYEALVRQPWFPHVHDLKGRPLWLGPFENAELSMNQLTHVRTVKDYYTLEDIGTLVLTVKTSAIDTIFWEAGTLNEGELLVVNKQGTILFSKSGGKAGEQVTFPFLQGEQQEAYIDEYEGAKTFVTYLPSRIEGWYLVALTPLDKMRAETISVRNLVFGLLALTLLSVILFDVWFIRKLVRTIISVVKAMRYAEAGAFTEVQMSQEVYRDESGLLVKGFNRMSRQIDDLIRRVEEEQQRKKEAEMQALVSQINPHFIYNSLETINSMAVLQGNKEISRLVISLGKLLRISISETQELVSIATELEHVRHYLFIQICRFGDKLQYELNVPEQLRKHMTLKLIVQPIVENALYHGIEPLQGQGIIRIEALEAGDDLIIEVRDNGYGIEAARLAELFGDAQSPALAGRTKHRGVGMKNVHDRLRIRFGPRYGILICSEMNVGTIVRIRIPRLGMDGRGGTAG